MDTRRSQLRPWKWPLWIVGLSIVFFFTKRWVTDPERRWKNIPYRDLNLTLVNYSVPATDFRGHRSIHWILNHEKFRAPNHQETWQNDIDYVGYRPNQPEASTRIESLNPDLNVDVVVVTDTYGVYSHDLVLPEEPSPSPRPNRSVFGGLSLADSKMLESFVTKGTRLICEFNCFNPPTEEPARKAMETLLGVSWTGWVGHVYLDPNDSETIPAWFPAAFTKQYPDRSVPTTAFLMLSHHSGRLVVFEDTDLEQLVPQVAMSELGKSSIPNISDQPFPFYSWFALTLAAGEDATLAHFNLPKRDDLKSWKKEQGLENKKFVAFTLNQNNGAYYLAGDFSNVGLDLGPFNRVDALQSNQKRKNIADTGNPANLFWTFFVPLMSHLIDPK